MADTVDSFTSNPLVQALGSHLGVDALFNGEGGFGFGQGTSSSSGGPPAAPPVRAVKAPAPRVEGSETPREFRQHAPMAKGAPTGRGSQPGQPIGMNLPGVMSPDVLMHPVVQGLLKQYGVDPTSAAENASPNMFITNPEAYQHHPVLSGMLERAMEAGAFTKGSSTVGEGISNVLQGMLGAQQARADKYNNQLMMPFAQATQVANLKSISDEQNFKQAQAKHYQDLEEHYTAMDDNRAELADIRRKQADSQDQIKRMSLVQKYQHDAQNVGFNDDERKQWEATWADAGNDPAKLDPEKLGNILAAARDRRNEESEAGKNKRADIMAGAHISGAKISASTRPINPEANAQKKEVYKQANTRLQNFSKALANTVGTFEGERYIAGTQKAKDMAAKLQKAADDAKTDWENNQVLQTPGMLPKGPGNKFPTYNPVTGQIERK